MLERIEAIISDCYGSDTDSTVPNYQSEVVLEAVIVTFKHVDATVAPGNVSINCM